MRKRFWAVLLVSVLTLSMPTNALAASYNGIESKQTSLENENGLTELWTREMWNYMQRNPSSLLYPNWTSAHKYKYYTKYYTNSSRTNYIGSSSYIDG